ncbi:MAG: hypothetical protein R3E79_31765 [Caldilineaceae bacterium]
MIAYQTESTQRQWSMTVWGKPLLGVLLLLLLALLTTEQVRAQSCTPYPSPQARFGYNVARDGGRRIEQYDVAPLQAHWYLDYFTQVTPVQPNGMAYAQMIRPPFWKQSTFTTTVESTLQNNPGTLWIIGNEPDRDKQDGLTPAQYAVFYHDVYTFLKTRDPSAHVATAGVVQSTPLRRRYLDMVLTEYQSRYGQAMPVDVWTVHAFILSENNPLWGAWNPPGLEEYADEGIQYTVNDHDNIEIFKANMVAFRQWMAERGYRDKPLLVTEYGILLSPLHGFPYSRVRSFMLASFDFFLTATDPNTGYPADDNRLVQAWSWFSLNYPPYDVETGFGHNGNLLEPDTGALLALGEDYGAYIADLDTTNQLVLAAPTLQLQPPTVVLTPTVAAAAPGATIPLTLTADVANAGNVTACNLTIRLWQRDPQGAVTLVGTELVATLPTSQGQNSQALTFTWPLDQPTAGLYEVTLEGMADNSNTGLSTVLVQQTYRFHVLAAPFDAFMYLPVVQR